MATVTGVNSPPPVRPAIPRSDKKTIPSSSIPFTVKNYRVDRETHEVTVYIMDRASRQIIRTIPPDELSKLKAGDLIELLA